MYNHLIFIGYMGAAAVGCIGLLLVVLLLVKGDEKRTVFYKKTRVFVANILALSVLYFIFFYLEFTAGIVEFSWPVRIVDYGICTVLPCTWCGLTVTMAEDGEDDKSGKLMRLLAVVTAVRFIVYIPVCVFFMDGFYYITNDTLRIYFPYFHGLFSAVAILFILTAAVVSFPHIIHSQYKKITFSELFALTCSPLQCRFSCYSVITPGKNQRYFLCNKKYMVFCTVLLIFLEANHVIVDNALFQGELGVSGWDTGLLDPTGLIGILVCLATITLVYRADFSPIFYGSNGNGTEDSVEKDKKIPDEAYLNKGAEKKTGATDDAALEIEAEAKTKLLLDQVAESHKLTLREREVLELVYRGLTNPEIAEKLFISKNTVKLHVSHIFEKFGVSSRIELIHLINAQSLRK